MQGPAERTCVVMDGGIAEHYAGHRNLMGRALADLIGEAAASKYVRGYLLFWHGPDSCADSLLAQSQCMQSG